METHIVAKGLAIQIPDELDITYQTLPFYDDHEFCLARWFSESLQYVMAINKLPDGWLDAEKWMAGFQRDMRSLSKWGSCKEGKSEVFVSPAGFAISSLEMYYVIKGQVGEELQKGTLKRILRDFELAPLPVNIVYFGGRKANAKIRSFIDLAVERLRANPFIDH